MSNGVRSFREVKKLYWGAETSLIGVSMCSSLGVYGGCRGSRTHFYGGPARWVWVGGFSGLIWALILMNLGLGFGELMVTN